MLLVETNPHTYEVFYGPEYTSPFLARKGNSPQFTAIFGLKVAVKEKRTRRAQIIRIMEGFSFVNSRIRSQGG
jgi:hypothetical protein